MFLRLESQLLIRSGTKLLDMWSVECGVWCELEFHPHVRDMPVDKIIEEHSAPAPGFLTLLFMDWDPGSGSLVNISGYGGSTSSNPLFNHIYLSSLCQGWLLFDTIKYYLMTNFNGMKYCFYFNLVQFLNKLRKFEILTDFLC